MTTNKLDDYTESEAKKLLNDICNEFGIGGSARTPSVIMTNVKNASSDKFCRYRKVIEFLEGKTFRFIKKAGGYVFTRPGHKSDFFGETILEAIERATNSDEA